MVTNPAVTSHVEMQRLLKQQKAAEKKLLKEIKHTDLKALAHVVIKQKDDLEEFYKLIDDSQAALKTAEEEEKHYTKAGAKSPWRKRHLDLHSDIRKKREEIIFHSNSAKEIFNKILEERNRMRWDLRFETNMLQRLASKGLKDEKLMQAFRKCHRLFFDFMKHLEILRDHMADVEHALTENTFYVSKKLVGHYKDELQERIAPETKRLVDEWHKLAGAEKEVIVLLKHSLRHIPERYGVMLQKVKDSKDPRKGFALDTSEDAMRRLETGKFLKFE